MDYIFEKLHHKVMTHLIDFTFNYLDQQNLLCLSWKTRNFTDLAPYALVIQTSLFVYINRTHFYF